MKVLHIFKSVPDETVNELIKEFSDHEEKKTALYQSDVDWDCLVDDIFASDKVISWW